MLDMIILRGKYLLRDLIMLDFPENEIEITNYGKI